MNITLIGLYTINAKGSSDTVLHLYWKQRKPLSFYAEGESGIPDAIPA